MSTTVSISCPACHRRFQTPPEWAGRRVKCPACSEMFTIPGAEPDPEPAPAVAATPSPAAVSDPSAAVLARLDALESDNRALGARLRRTRVGFAVALAVAAVAAATPALLLHRRFSDPSPLTPHNPDILETRGIIVRDAAGVTIASLGPTADDGSAALSLYVHGKERVALTALDDRNGFLSFRDPGGNKRLVLGGGHGTPVGVWLHAPDAKVRANLALAEGVGDAPFLGLWDTLERPRAFLGMSRADLPRFDFMDEDGKSVIPQGTLEGPSSRNPRP